jgi:hypothetical protein
VAKAEGPPNADAWPPEGLPLDAACARTLGSLWADYAAARDAAAGPDDIRRKNPYALTAEEKQRVAHGEATKAALTASIRSLVKQGEYEVWARPGSPIADPKPIPASALDALEFDFEQRTARGENLPLLCDVRLRQTHANVATSVDEPVAVEQVYGGMDVIKVELEANQTSARLVFYAYRHKPTPPFGNGGPL